MRRLIGGFVATGVPSMVLAAEPEASIAEATAGGDPDDNRGSFSGKSR